MVQEIKIVLFSFLLHLFNILVHTMLIKLNILVYGFKLENKFHSKNI